MSKINAKLDELIRLLVSQATASGLGKRILVIVNPSPVVLGQILGEYPAIVVKRVLVRRCVDLLHT